MNGNCPAERGNECKEAKEDNRKSKSLKKV